MRKWSRKRQAATDYHVQGASMWRWDELTNREKLIAAMITADGQSDNEVARAFGLTKHWASNIVGIIHVKLKTQSGRQSRLRLAFLVGQHWAEISAEVEHLKQLKKGSEI